MPAEGASATRKRQRTSPSNRAAYPRRRAAQACRTCRRRRTKCDNEQPACTSCADLGIQCGYEEGELSTFDSASLAILRRFDRLEDLIRTTNSGTQNSVVVSSPLATSKDLGSPSLERSEAAVLYYINIETVLSWSVFQDQNWDPRLDLRYLLQSRSSIPEATPLSITPDFETNVAGHLLERFFENVHIYNPVLEIAKVKGYLRDAQFNGLGWDAQSCLLLLVYSLGSVTTDQENAPSESSSTFRRSEGFRQAESFFFAAQKRMGILLCKSSVIEAQCFFLAGVYLMTTQRPVEAWKMFVQALACCQGFWTHRSPNNSQDDEEKQLQESIYWTCFKSELELRLELNVANNSVWDLTYPAFFPTPPKELKTHSEDVWYFYLAEIALRRLGNRILNYIYQYESSHTATADIVEAILNFEQQATGWLNSLPLTLKLDSPVEDTSDASNRHSALRFILSGHLLDCYEMMYWPFVVDAIQGRLRIDPESQSFARKGFLLCVQRIEKNESGFYQRHHGTWLMLRSCTRSALVLIGAVRSGLKTLVPADWREAVGKVMQMLRYWRDEAKDVPSRLDILERSMEEIASSPSSY